MYQPNQALFVDIAQEAMRFLRLQEQDQVLNEELTAEERAMPVFSHLNHHIKEVLVKTKEFAKRNERSRSGGNFTTNNGSGNTFNGNSGNPRHIPKGLEIAASATDRSTEQTIKLRMIDNMSFNKEVMRNDMLGYKHQNGNIFLYTATKKACKKCVTKHRHEAPTCYTRKCNRCGLFGHTDFYCKQVVENQAHSADTEFADDEENPTDDDEIPV